MTFVISALLQVTFSHGKSISLRLLRLYFRLSMLERLLDSSSILINSMNLVQYLLMVHWNLANVSLSKTGPSFRMVQLDLDMIGHIVVCILSCVRYLMCLYFYA